VKRLGSGPIGGLASKPGHRPHRQCPLRAARAQLLFASGLRPVVGVAWLLPIVAALGAVGAISTDVYLVVGPWALPSTHDIGLLVFEAAWVALGVALLAGRPSLRRRPSQLTRATMGSV
jgi:hypothetical protein